MTATRPKGRRELSAEVLKKAQTRERLKSLALVWGLVAVTVGVLGTLLVIGLRNASPERSAAPAKDLNAVSGLGAAAAAPWSLPANTPARVNAAGMSLGQMGTADHYHAHLDIIVDGKSVGMPTNLGIDTQSGAMAAVHTHSSDGIIHVEAGTKGQPFTLGQLFTAWNVRLTADQIGSYTAGGAKTLTAYVNGKKMPGDPAMIRLAERQQITLVYGAPDPALNIPKSFDFSSGG